MTYVLVYSGVQPARLEMPVRLWHAITRMCSMHAGAPQVRHVATRTSTHVWRCHSAGVTPRTDLQSLCLSCSSLRGALRGMARALLSITMQVSICRWPESSGALTSSGKDDSCSIRLDERCHASADRSIQKLFIAASVAHPWKGVWFTSARCQPSWQQLVHFV